MEARPKFDSKAKSQCSQYGQVIVVITVKSPFFIPGRISLSVFYRSQSIRGEIKGVLGNFNETKTNFLLY